MLRGSAAPQEETPPALGSKFLVDDSNKGPSRAFFVSFNGAETLCATCRERDQRPQGLFHCLKAFARLHANPAHHVRIQVL